MNNSLLLPLLMQSLYYHTPIKSNYLCDMSCEHDIDFPIEDYAIKIACFDEVLNKVESNQDKLILILKCIGYSYRDISKVVNVSASTVRRKNIKILELLKNVSII